MNKNYFNLVSLGWNGALKREEIQIHCGDNGNLFIIKTDDGFKVEVFGQNNSLEEIFINEDELVDAVNEEYLEPYEPYEPTFIEVKKFILDWGQTDGELKENLGYAPDADVDDILMLDYFWFEKKQIWLPKISSMYSEEEEMVSHYLRLNYCTPINDTVSED